MGYRSWAKLGGALVGSVAFGAAAVADQAPPELGAHNASGPCIGVDLSLTAERRSKLAQVIAREDGSPGVTIGQFLRFAGWSIIGFERSDHDGGYLVYSADPESAPSVASWGGAQPVDNSATTTEQAVAGGRRVLTAWLLKDAPAIPLRLAECFEWGFLEHGGW
jgi:hypothetical protein